MAAMLLELFRLYVDIRNLLNSKTCDRCLDYMTFFLQKDPDITMVLNFVEMLYLMQFSIYCGPPQVVKISVNNRTRPSQTNCFHYYNFRVIELFPLIA